MPGVREISDPRVPPDFRRLPEIAREHGWAVGHQFSVDNGGSPFVTVAIAKRAAYYVRLTWHTRATGTYRLFSKIMRTESDVGPGPWRDTPSLSRIHELIAASKEGDQSDPQQNPAVAGSAAVGGDDPGDAHQLAGGLRAAVA
jgi:hypothetical protein